MFKSSSLTNRFQLVFQQLTGGRQGAAGTRITVSAPATRSNYCVSENRWFILTISIHQSVRYLPPYGTCCVTGQGLIRPLHRRRPRSKNLFWSFSPLVVTSLKIVGARRVVIRVSILVHRFWSRISDRLLRRQTVLIDQASSWNFDVKRGNSFPGNSSCFALNFRLSLSIYTNNRLSTRRLTFVNTRL